MNLINQMMNYDKSKNVNLDTSKIEKDCACEECKSVIQNENKDISIKYPSLSEEEIEQIIKERYDYKDEKTKTFIRKSLRKHGDRYDYSNVVYTRAKDKVEIICRVEGHKPFPMRPNTHLNGHGCKRCSIERNANKRRKPLEKLIKEFNEVHEFGTYNYSKVNYVDMNTNVIITCPIHGDFPQTPANHLNGKGCKLCGYEKVADKLRKPLEKLIKEFNEVHGEGTYDYSKVEYVNMSTDVIIICPIHGDFKQTPAHHMNGEGCPTCGGNKKLITEEFIKRANEVQGIGSYDYSKVNYINIYTDVIIICPKHGPFPQTPNDHLNGHGCSKCNKNKGEESVRKFLTEKRIEFEEQKTFNGCKNKRKLKFDFYLPKYNLCIESDGNPHYRKVNWNGKMTDDEMEEKLKLNQKRDNIKNEYCKNNNIILLRVKADRAYKELSKYFQTNNIIN